MKPIKLLAGFVIIAAMGFVPMRYMQYREGNSSQAQVSEKLTETDATIYIAKGGFDPQEYWVVPGAVITWVNADSESHTVTFDKIEVGSGDIAPGGSFSYAFSATGPYGYHCSYHPEEIGAIHVVIK